MPSSRSHPDTQTLTRRRTDVPHTHSGVNGPLKPRHRLLVHALFRAFHSKHAPKRRRNGAKHKKGERQKKNEREWKRGCPPNFATIRVWVWEKVVCPPRRGQLQGSRFQVQVPGSRFRGCVAMAAVAYSRADRHHVAPTGAAAMCCCGHNNGNIVTLYSCGPTAKRCATCLFPPMSSRVYVCMCVIVASFSPTHDCV